MSDETTDAAASEETTSDAPETPAAEAAPAADAPSSPWADDLGAVFTDPEQASAVDGFLREKVQPYVTKLEQQSSENRNANRLWDDFTNQPAETYISVTEELFGSEQAEAIRSLLDGEGSTDEEGTNVDEPNDTSYDLTELPKEVREAVEFVQSQKSQSNWDRLLGQLKQDNPDLKINENLFAPFVNAADGDVDVALNGYKAWIDQAKDEFGLASEVPTTDEVADTPPPAIGSGQQAPSAPPINTQPESVEEAIEELFSEMKSAEAPVTVGQG